MVRHIQSSSAELVVQFERYSDALRQTLEACASLGFAVLDVSGDDTSRIGAVDFVSLRLKGHRAASALVVRVRGVSGVLSASVRRP